MRLADGRELRLREFGSKQAAWVKLLRSTELEDDDALATLAPEAWPDPPPLEQLLDAPRPLHALLRDQHAIVGVNKRAGRDEDHHKEPAHDASVWKTRAEARRTGRRLEL